MYQLNVIKKIKTTKKAPERYQNLSKEEKVSRKTSQKMKKLKLLSTEKNITE